MPIFCVIDLGSNAIRLAISSVERGKQPRLIYTCREAIRIGEDVFTAGIISGETIRRCVTAFEKFRFFINEHKVKRVTALGTSALRDAGNQREFISRIAQASGITITPIDGAEEARLISRAVETRINLQNKNAVLFDIGGGSVQIVLLEEGVVTKTKSYQAGCVRLLHLFGNNAENATEFTASVRRYLALLAPVVRAEIGTAKTDVCVGLGGSVNILGCLRKQLQGKHSDRFLLIKELKKIIAQLQSLSCQERIAELKLSPDRADVILPASVVLEFLMEHFNMDKVMIPYVTLKDGALVEMAAEEEKITGNSVS
ncbi:MAG TPA: hypothetical protein PKZ12_07515 [Smithellaceae bacterium]|nr:hypothetical protein [Smithellaceae bacterium]